MKLQRQSGNGYFYFPEGSRWGANMPASTFTPREAILQAVRNPQAPPLDDQAYQLFVATKAKIEAEALELDEYKRHVALQQREATLAAEESALRESEKTLQSQHVAAVAAGNSTDGQQAELAAISAKVQAIAGELRTVRRALPQVASEAKRACGEFFKAAKARMQAEFDAKLVEATDALLSSVGEHLDNLATLDRARFIVTKEWQPRQSTPTPPDLKAHKAAMKKEREAENKARQQALAAERPSPADPVIGAYPKAPQLPGFVRT